MINLKYFSESGQKLRWMFPILCFLISSLFIPIVVSSSPSLSISSEPDDLSRDIIINIEPGSDERSVSIYINHAGEEILDNLTLYGWFVDSQDNPLSVGKVVFLVADSEEPLGKITLKPNKPFRAMLKVSDFGTRYGEFDGRINAEHNGSYFPISSFTVTRPGSLALNVNEADSNNEIKLVTKTMTLDDVIYISESGGYAGTHTVELSISPLRSAEGRLMTITPNPEDFTIGPSHRSQSISLRGTASSVEIYEGMLTLQWGENQMVYNIKVESKGKSPVKFEPVKEVRREKWLTQPAIIKIPLLLQEVTGRNSTIYYPTLTKLEFVTHDDQIYDVPPDWYIHGSTGDKISTTTQEGEQLEIHFSGNDERTMTLYIKGLKHTGKYNARVNVSSPSGAVESMDLIIRLRDNWYSAGLIILVGALCSFAMHRWFDIIRPRRITQIDIDKMIKRVKSVIVDEEDIVREALLNKLEEITLLQKIGNQPNIKKELQTIQTHLEDYKSVIEVRKLRNIVPDGHKIDYDEKIKIINDKIISGDPLSNLTVASKIAKNLIKQINEWRARYFSIRWIKV